MIGKGELTQTGSGPPPIGSVKNRWAASASSQTDNWLPIKEV